MSKTARLVPGIHSCGIFQKTRKIEGCSVGIRMNTPCNVHTHLTYSKGLLVKYLLLLGLKYIAAKDVLYKILYKILI